VVDGAGALLLPNWARGVSVVSRGWYISPEATVGTGRAFLALEV